MVNRPLKQPANPGASATALVFDNGVNTEGTLGPIPSNSQEKAVQAAARVRVIIWTNVADAVLRVEWQARGSSNLRLVQADVAIAANTFVQRDIRLQPGRTRITIVTVTAPTTWEVDNEIAFDQALAQ